MDLGASLQNLLAGDEGAAVEHLWLRVNPPAFSASDFHHFASSLFR
jgi:hypothetical protein